MKIKSYAKINLTLDILGKREDGYHEIKTVFQHISLYDEIMLKKTKKEIVVKSNIDELNNENNICYKTAKILKDKFNITSGVNIFIKKNIPIAAGLSGGSSNAAAVLKGLNRLWKLQLDQKDLIEISKEIGMDVAFHLIGGTCLGEGRGEILKKLGDLPTYYIVLIYPDIKLNTKEMYASLDYSKIGKTSSTNLFLKNFNLDYIHNDFEYSVFSLYPEIKRIRETLGKHSLLSGSGSSIFKITNDKKEAKKTFELMKKQYKKVFLLKTKNFF